MEYADAEVYVHEQKKINSQYTGLTVDFGKNNANPTINLEAFHEEYENGKLMEDVLYDIAKIMQMEGPQVDVSRLSDYDKIKDSLFIRVCNSKENKGLLKNVPHVEIEDMAVTCHILVAKDFRGISSTPVTNDMLKMYGIREEQLFDDALESSPKVNTPEIVNMDELMEGIYREQYEMMGYSVRRQIEIGVNCILNSRLLPTRLCSHTGNCTVQEGKLQLLVALFQGENFPF